MPLALKNNATLDIGVGNVDPGRFAIGYTVQADVNFSPVMGGNVGPEVSVVQFTDATYGNYNYVYAGGHEGISLGAQMSIGASVGESISIAYNTSDKPIDPTSYTGNFVSAGVSAGVKFIAGGGVSGSFFTDAAKNGGWRGVSLGVSGGVGVGVNVGSVTASLSNNVVVNDVKPTAQRSMTDRITNTISPILSAIVTGTIDKIKQYTR